MTFKEITNADALWHRVIAYAETCSWRAGQSLANQMKTDHFQDWERVIVAVEKGTICGYCTVTQRDCLPNVSYTPYIGYVFIDEAYRGKRLSQKMIQHAMAYLKSNGFDKVYLVSDHENLYEKYGFAVIDRKTAPWGSEEKVYMQKL